MAKPKILIVEDEWIIANDIKTSLEGLGYRVISLVSSGVEAVEQSGQKKPDLVLMDIVLKGKVSGIDAARKIISEFGIPVIFLTAYSDDEIIKKAKKAKAHGYLIKPFHDRELQATIELALYKSRADKQIKDSENQLFTTLKSISDAVISVDNKGQILFINPVAQSMVGYGQKETKGKKLEHILTIRSFPPNGKRKNLAKDILKSENLCYQEIYTMTAVGKEDQIIELRSSPIKDENEDIQGSVIMFRDITKQKKTERELIVSQNRLEYVKQIGALANSSLNLDLVLESILKGTLEASGATVGMIFLKNQDDGTLSLGASIGLSNAFIEEYANSVVQPGEGLTGSIVINGNAIFIPEDSSNDPRITRPVIMTEGLNSFIGVPIYAASEIVGVMNILTRSPEILSEHDITLAAAIGSYVGSAIRNAQHYEERMRIEKRLLEYQKQLQSLTSRISLIEENEKRRIAAELHDGIGQYLALSKIKLGQLRKTSGSPQSEEIINDLQKLLDQTINETRTLTFELSPPILYELGLSQAIQWLIDEFRDKHGLTTTFHDTTHETPFNNTIRFFLFQAVRELLLNIVKHSGADTADIGLSSDNEEFRITIEDNGVGYADPSVDRSGFGLFHISERMNHINGKFEIAKMPDRGTRVTLVVPLLRKMKN